MFIRKTFKISRPEIPSQQIQNLNSKSSRANKSKAKQIHNSCR